MTTERTHEVICGDNLDALTELAATHTGSVDVIYIDPPYNTGNNSWIYNDNREHNEWMQFMRERLHAAKPLLSKTGIIAVSISDEAHHHIRYLLDEVFGPATFLANITWQGQTNTASPVTSGGIEYIVVHAARPGHRPEWREPKPGVAEALSKAAEFWTMTGGDREEAMRLMRRWWNHDGKHHPRGLRDYTRIDEHGRLYRPGPLAAPDRPEQRSHRPLTHPTTGRPCPVPPTGWRANDATMDAWVTEGRVEFADDETVLPVKKLFLDEQDWQRPAPVFYQPRRSNHVDNLLGDKRFPYPKDHEVLARWLRMWTPLGGVVLDFFAGSGSTLEAVIRLNLEDGGARQGILVTNNEVSDTDRARLAAAGHQPGDAVWEARGVFEHVTRPRIDAVITGVRPDGAPTGLAPAPANVTYRHTTPRAGMEDAA